MKHKIFILGAFVLLGAVIALHACVPSAVNNPAADIQRHQRNAQDATRAKNPNNGTSTAAPATTAQQPKAKPQKKGFGACSPDDLSNFTCE